LTTLVVGKELIDSTEYRESSSMLNRGFCRIGFIGESLNFEGESVFFLAIYVGGLFFCWGVFS